VTKKFVVTGGAGFIGSHLAEALVKEGAAVTVIDNLATGYLSNLEPIRKRIDFIECDINDCSELAQALKGADTLFHLAAIPSVPRSIHAPVPSHEANISGTFRILMAAREARVRRVVYSGSSSAYGDNPAAFKSEEMTPAPKSPYAVQKLTGELYTLQFDSHFGVEGVVLRYFNIFGPRQDPDSPYAGVIPLFIKRISAGLRPNINGDGSITRDFTYVDNAVALNIRAALVPEARGQVFNAACGTSFTLNQLVDAINGALGTRVSPTYGPERPGDIRGSRADITRARTTLGYEPLVSFEEGIRRTAASMLAAQGETGA
jgi:UDP-N-acetylglucosamine/UDP-N-acetyl-alpha-D-glucosaminouronate 4-epimerase